MAETTELELPDNMRLEEAPPVNEPIVETPEEKPRSPHSEAMARIAANYEKTQRASEIAYGEELAHEAALREAPEVEAGAAELAGAEPAEPAAAKAPLAAPAPAPERAAIEPQAAHPAAPTHRVLEIDGQQFQVTEDQFNRLAQQGAIANLAIQQAQRTAPQGYQVPAQQPAPQQPYVAPQPGPVIDRETAAAIHNRIAYGGAEDGVAALQELATSIYQRAQSAAPQIDPARLRAEATQEALQTIQLQTNLERIGAEFPEVFNNRTRAYTAALHLTELRQQDALLGRQRPDLELYREACKMVRDAFTPPQPQSGGEAQPTALQAAPNVQVQPDRLERKRAAPRNPAAVSRAAGLGPEAPRPPSASQIVDQMRRTRGQLSLN